MIQKYIFSAAVIFFLSPFALFAGTSDNVSGWAWSGNIGWISFNCTDTGTCATSDYGVNLASTGDLSGHAWSSNIGWITFDPPGPYPEGPQESANVNLANGQVRGWTRALSPGGGWDGWIKLRGPSYGVDYDGSTGEFSGFAWGGDVVGWLKFRDSGFGVTTTLSSPPSSVSLSATPSSGPAPLVVSLRADELSGACAASSANALHGFAWSSNIGWVGVNCEDSDSCASTNFKVELDTSTGDLSGHAWSSNIGWVTFDPPGPYPEGPQESANVNLANGQVRGWARALSPGGGWDGWIKLRGPSYGVDYDGLTGEFSGFAWGGDVVGWLKFRDTGFGVSTASLSLPCDYSFWWHCDNLTTSVSTAETACGTLPAPVAGSCVVNTAGARCEDFGSSAVPPSNTYSSDGTFSPKVIVERAGVLPSTAFATVFVTTPAPDFSLAKSPGAISATTTGTGAVASTKSLITVIPFNGFSSSVNLSIESVSPALPAEAVHKFLDPVSGDSDTNLDSLEYSEGAHYRVVVPASAASGEYVITIRGEDGGLVRTTTLLLNVAQQEPDFEEVFLPFLKLVSQIPVSVKSIAK